MPDNISALYGALKKNDFQVPENEDDFRKAIQNPKIVNELHSALKQNDFQVPESVNDFSSWLNPTQQEVKKKEETPSTSGGAYVRPLSQGGGEPAQSFSEATLGRLSDEQFSARKEVEANRQKAIEKEQARVRKEQFYSNVKPIAQSTAEDIDLFAPNNSLPSTGEIYQTLKQIEINKAKGFQYKPKPITQPLASDVTKTTITPRLTATLSEEERNRQLALKGKEKEEETSLTETKEEATPLQKTLTLASNVAKGAVGVGRDFAQVGDLLIRKGIENTFEGEPKKYKPEVQGIIDRVRGYNLQRGDEAFEKDLGQYFYEHPEYKTSDVAQTARGLGQVIPSVVVGLLTGGTGVFAQTAIQGTLSGTQIFNEAYKRAKEYGTDDETAIKTAFLDAVGESYVDAFPTLKLLNRFNKTVGGGFWNKAKQSAKEAGVAFVEGGTSEGLQKIVSNAIASYNYDDNVALLDDVFEEGKIGGFTQSLLSLGLSAIKHARVKAKTPQQKAELDKKEASLYDAMKNQNIVSPPMEGEAPPPTEGGAPPTTPPVGGTDIAVEETLEDKKAKAGESLRNLLGKVTAEEKAVTPQGEEPLVEGNTPEEIATNIQVKLNDIKTQRAKILGGLPKDESGKRIKNDEAQAQLDDLEEQEFRLQEYDSQNKQRVSGEVGEGQKPVEAQPVGAGSEEAVAPNRIFQTPTQEVIIPDTPAGHVTAVMENPTDDNIQKLADNAASLGQEVIRQGNDQGIIPQEKMPMLKETTPVGKEPKVEEAKAGVVGEEVVGKTFRDNYNRTFEVKYENAGILTLEDVDTGKVLRKKKNEVLSNFKEIAENDNNNEQYINLINKVGKNEELTKDDIRTKMDMQDKQPYEYDKDVFDKLYSVSIKTAGNDKGITLKNKVTGETNWIHASDLGFFGRMLGKESIMTPEVFKKVFQEKNKKAALDIAYKNKIEEAEYQKSKKTPKVEQSLKETPVAEAPKTKPTEALKDVESTAKALEGVIGKNVKRETNETIINLEKQLKKAESERTNYLLEGKTSITIDEKLKNAISELKRQIFNEENKLALIRKDTLQKMIDSNQLKTAIENNLITAENARLETIGNGIEVPSWLQKIVDSNKAKKEIATDSILNRTTDFLGKEKMEFMIPKTDPSVRTKDMVDYLVFHVKRAIENGKYENAIAEGRMTAKDAKTIIESYGLKVPSKIQQLLGKPTEAPKAEAPKVEIELTKQEEKVAENLKISKDDARKAKQASPRRTRKSKDIAEIIESETKIAEDSKNATKAEELIETIEIAEKSILENQEVDESFEQKYGVSEIALVKEIKDMGKQGNFFDAYKNLTGKDADLQIEIDFLSSISAQGIKVRPRLAPEFTVENHTVQTKKLSKKPSKKKGLDSLDAIVGKDDLKPILKAVYFDGDKMVATDAHKLIIIARQESDADIIEKLIEANYAKTKKTVSTYTREQASAYIKEQLKDGLQGKSLNFQDGIVEEGRYPDYKAVIPTKYPSVAKIAVQEFIDILNGAKAVKDNLLDNNFAINFLVDNNNVYFNPTFLLEAVSAMQENGAKSIELFHNGDPSKSILLKSDNGNEGIVMPITVKNEFPITQEIDITKPAKAEEVAKPVQAKAKPIEVATKEAEAKPSKVTKEPAPQKAETKAETLEDKKAKAGESLRNLLGKTGVIKNIVPSEDSDTWNDIKNIADYIAAETGKKGKELIEAIKKYLKTNGGEAIIPQIETYEKRIIAESSQEGVETTEPTNIRIFEELDAINEKRIEKKIDFRDSISFNKKYGDKAQLAKDITNNFEKYIDKLLKEGIIVKVKC